MSQHRFVRCPHCKMPHDAAEQICPRTGRRIAAESHRPRMADMPPAAHAPAPAPAPAPARAERYDRAPPPPPNGNRDLVGQVLGGRYEVHGILGEGGMGTVYDAFHRGLGRPVAIKILNPSQAKKRVAVKRFQQEARAAGAIGHPNICEVYDMGLLDDASPYLVMERLVGTTLADRIAREGGLPFDEIIDVMIQVLSGLIAAHEKGIVHRDIKPENIFLAQRLGCPPIAKILDFGVSKMMAQFAGPEDQLDLTRTGMVMGTPYYMSPEQARGERNLDGRVDVYACGVMMYESIVGRRPFLAPNYNALLLAIINSTPKPIREARPATPPAIEAVVTRAMMRAREDRYPSAHHFLRDVQSLFAPKTSGSGRSPPMQAPMGQPAMSAGTRRAHEPEGSASARLRSRMAAAPPPAAFADDSATRIHPRREALSKPSKKTKTGSDSVELPIHFRGQGAPDHPTPRASRRSEYSDDLPTEVLRPGTHLPRGRSPIGAPVPPPPPAPPPSDWDGEETVVRRPSDAPPPAPKRNRQMSPEQTVKLDGEAPLDIDFGDVTHVAPPRGRPR